MPLEYCLKMLLTGEARHSLPAGNSCLSQVPLTGWCGTWHRGLGWHKGNLISHRCWDFASPINSLFTRPTKFQGTICLFIYLFYLSICGWLLCAITTKAFPLINSTIGVRAFLRVRWCNCSSSSTSVYCFICDVVLRLLACSLGTFNSSKRKFFTSPLLKRLLSI